MAAYASPDFSFEVREHVAYCFACVGRSLPPDEQAALVLGDVADMSARDSAKVLGVSESVFRHRLAAARQAMRDRYEGLCALVSKTGMCHQCKGLREIAAEGRRGGPLPDVSDYADRLAVVRSADFADGKAAALTTSSGAGRRRSRRPASARPNARPTAASIEAGSPGRLARHPPVAPAAVAA